MARVNCLLPLSKHGSNKLTLAINNILYIVLLIVLLNALKVIDMNSITANELKTKGVSVVESALQDDDEAIITVRGKDKYVIIDMDKYNRLREHELEIALLETRADLAQGRVKRESVAEHMKRVTK